MSYKCILNIIEPTIYCIIILFVICGIPAIIYHIVVKPKDPIFTLEYASITGFNLTSDDHLTSVFDLVIRVENRNHILKLKYSKIRISILKTKQKLAKDALDNFSQRKRNVTMLRSEAMALDVGLKKAPAFDIRFESGVGYLDFDVYLTGKVHKHLVQYNLEVKCNAVVNITSPSYVAVSPKASNYNEDYKSNFPSTKCRVQIYNDQYY